MVNNRYLAPTQQGWLQGAGGGAPRLPPQWPRTGNKDDKAAVVVGTAAMKRQWQGWQGQQQQQLLVLLVVFSMLINCK
jgi:hypothetical protein